MRVSLPNFHEIVMLISSWKQGCVSRKFINTLFGFRGGLFSHCVGDKIFCPSLRYGEVGVGVII